MDFLIVNGKVISKSEMNLTEIYHGSSFHLSEKAWFGFGGIPLLTNNIERLLSLIGELKLPLPPLLKNKRELSRITKRMLNKNKFYRSGLVHFNIIWKENTANTIITSEAFQQIEFPFTDQGTLMNFSQQKIFSGNQFNRFGFYHNLTWNVAKLEIEGTHFQNSIILNEKDAACESINGNIFMIKGDTCITPSLRSGCYEDTIRSFVLKLIAGMRLKVHEQTVIKTDELNEMDEIFIAGEETGFQWVLGVEGKRYIHQYADVVYKEFNRMLREKMAN